MLSTGDVKGSVYGSLVRIQRGWAYRYQYRGHPMATPNVPQLLFLMVI
jgi:hypothetical protein